jgi:RNA recognition motif-containing protein
MSFTVFLGNLPTWVTKDDILSWLRAENLVADEVKVIRNPETQESKGFAFIDAPNQEEMESIIRRFDRAPLEDRILRANPAQPPRPKGSAKPMMGRDAAPPMGGGGAMSADRPKRGGKKHKKGGRPTPQSAFAEELAKAL